MTHSIQIKDRIKQGTTTAGVGTLSLDITYSSSGFQDFSVLGNGVPTYYAIEESPNQWEVGIGTYSSSTLTRDTILDSSNGGSKISLGGSGLVFVTYPASKSVFEDTDKNIHVTGVVVGVTGVKFNDGTIQTTAAQGYDWVVSDGAGNSETVGSGDTVYLSGVGATDVTYDTATNIVSISGGGGGGGVTYYDGTGLNLDPSTTFNVSGATIDNSGIAQLTNTLSQSSGLAATPYLVSGVSGVLQSELDSQDSRISSNTTTILGHTVNIANNQSNIASNTSALYNHWTVSDGTNSENITKEDQVIFTGAGNSTVSYDTASNTVTVSGTPQTTYDWNVADGNGNSELVGSGDTVYWSGVGGAGVTYSPSTNIVSISGTTYSAGTGLTLDPSTTFNASGATIDNSGISQLTNVITDSSGLAVTPYAVSGVSGDLQSNINVVSSLATTNLGNIVTNATNITANATNISTNTANISTNDTDISNLSGLVATNTTDISTNDTDISNLSGLVSTNTTNVSTNDTDISNLSGLVSTNTTNISTNDTDISSLSGLVSTNTTNISTNDTDISNLSGLVYDYWTVSGVNGSGHVDTTEAVIFTGVGNVSVTLTGTDNRTVSISGAGGSAGGYDWNVADGNGNSELIASGDTVYFSGDGLTDVTYDSATNIISVSGSEYDWNVADGNGNSEAITLGDTVYFSGVDGAAVDYDSATNTVSISGSQGVSRVACRMVATGVTSVPEQSSTQISLDTIDYQYGSISGTTSNNGRIYLLESGVYLINAQVQSSGNNSVRHSAEVEIWKNGAEMPVGQSSYTVSSDPATYKADNPTRNASVVVTGISGDYYDVRLWHDASSSTAADTTMSDSCWLSVVKLEGTKGDKGDQGPTGGIAAYYPGSGLSFDPVTTFNVSGTTIDNSGMVQLTNTLSDSSGLGVTPYLASGVSGALQSDIDTNAVNILTNDTDISNLSGLVSTNTTNISTNDTDISNLSGLVTTNTTNISTNDTDISNLSGLVTTNTTDISTNDTDISNLSGLVYDYWTVQGDSADTGNVDNTEVVQFTGAGNVSVTLGSPDNRTVTISGNDVSNTYTANTGLVLVGGTEFNTARTGNFEQITSTYSNIRIGEDTPNNGSYNVLLGVEAGKGGSADSCNLIGYRAGWYATGVDRSTFIGTDAGLTGLDVDYTVFIGNRAGETGQYIGETNAIGSNAARSASSITGTNIIGRRAGMYATGSLYNNIIGNRAGYSILNCDNNNMIGSYAGDNADGCDHNQMIGSYAGSQSSGAFYSNLIGHYAGYQATGTSAYTQMIGAYAGRFTDNCDWTNFIGYQAGESSATAHTSNFIGYRAGTGTVGHNNVNMIGTDAGAGSIFGDNSNMIGYLAGSDSSGASNHYIGYRAGYKATGTQNIEIVTDGANPSIIGTNDYKIHIDNTIIGDMSSKKLAIGDVGASNLTPDATLEILPRTGTDVGIIVQPLDPNPTANLTEWQSGDATILAKVTSEGCFSGQCYQFADGTSQTTTATYYAGTGLNLDPTTYFNVSGSTVDDRGIVQLTNTITDSSGLATTPYAVSGVSGALQSAINTNGTDINTVSGLLYNHWTISDGANSENITKEDQVNFTGGGNTTVSYDTASNTVTVSGTSAGGYDWTIADGDGNSEVVPSGDTIYFSGVDGTDVSYDTATNIVSISGGSSSLSGDNSCRLSTTTSTSCADDAVTQVTLDTLDYEYGNSLSGNATTSRIYLRESGVYLVNGQVGADGPTSIGWGGARVRKNGATPSAAATSFYSELYYQDDGIFQNCSTVVTGISGDYFTLLWYNDNNQNWDADTIENHCWLSVSKLGAGKGNTGATGPAGAGGSYDWNVADGNGNSETVSSGDTVYWSGVDGTDVTYDPSTNIFSIAGGSSSSTSTGNVSCQLTTSSYTLAEEGVQTNLDLDTVDHQIGNISGDITSTGPQGRIYLQESGVYLLTAYVNYNGYGAATPGGLGSLIGNWGLGFNKNSSHHRWVNADYTNQLYSDAGDIECAGAIVVTGVSGDYFSAKLWNANTSNVDVRTSTVQPGFLSMTKLETRQGEKGDAGAGLTPHYANLSATGVQSVNNATWSQIEMDTTDDIYGATTGNYGIKIERSGLYQINYQLGMDTSYDDEQHFPLIWTGTFSDVITDDKIIGYTAFNINDIAMFLRGSHSMQWNLPSGVYVYAGTWFDNYEAYSYSNNTSAQGYDTVDRRNPKLQIHEVI